MILKVNQNVYRKVKRIVWEKKGEPKPPQENAEKILMQNVEALQLM
jgi:hypothetical protein